MSTTQEVARVHPSTLTRLSTGDLPLGRDKPRQAPTRQPHVHVIQVDPRVWRTALHLAGRDRSRIQVVSPTEVIVR
jgi:hypothetical protein